jgi:hypothetical protein
MQFPRNPPLWQSNRRVHRLAGPKLAALPSSRRTSAFPSSSVLSGASERLDKKAPVALDA